MITTDLTDRDLRQRELMPPEKMANCTVLVIGVGAIGRQVALQLAATGVPEMTIVDHDTVDVVNLAPQGYMPEDLGNPKVNATAEWCKRVNPELIMHAEPERFVRSLTNDLDCFKDAKHIAVFCCVDSIETRRLIWDVMKVPALFFVDARMSAETVRVLACDKPAFDDYYKTTLFTQEQAFVGSCTARSTIYSASIAAGLMVCQFSRWLRGLPVERDMLLNLLAGELTMT